MKLIQGQTNARIEVEADMMDGAQNLQSLLDESTITIEYKYRNYAGDDVSGTWNASYFMEDLIPIVYYEFAGEDAVPDDARHLAGRIVVEDSDGRIVKGRQWTINIQPDEL